MTQTNELKAFKSIGLLCIVCKLEKQCYSDYLYTVLIWSTNILLYSPTGGYLCNFRFVHSSTQQVGDTKQDISLKDVILAPSWGAKIKCLSKIPGIQYL